MAEEKSLPLPEKELPPPHDMLLEKEAKDGKGANTPPPPGKSSGMSFWDKYGAKKWLLPLLIVVLILFGVVAVAGLTADKSSESRSRQERRMERAEKKAERRQKKSQRRQQKKQNKKSNKKASSNQNFVNFRYTSGANVLTMQYPGDMKVNTSTGKAALSSTDIPVITFTGQKSIIRISFEPNTQGLSVTNWLAQLAKQNEVYSNATEPITISGKSSLLQHTLSKTANWNAYIPLSGQILWVNMNYGGPKKQAQADFQQILDTIQIGAPSPTLPALPTAGM